MKKVLVIILILIMVSLSGCVIELGDGLVIDLEDMNLDNIDFENFDYENDYDYGSNSRIGDMKTYTQEIELEDEESLEVVLDVSAGKISLEKSEDKLFEGIVKSNIRNLNPIMDLHGNRLTIKDDFKYNSIRRFTNNWDLKITDEIPVDLDIQTNASKNRLDFTGIKVTDLAVSTNASDTDIEFNEKNEVELEDFSIDTNAGKVEVYGLGNARPKEIDVEVNAGSVTLDFDDIIYNDIEISIEGNASQTTIDLPDNVGISIEKRTKLTSLNIKESKFDRDDDVYTSDNYDTAEYKVDIKVRGTAFSLSIE